MPGREGLAVGCGRAGVYVEFRLDKVIGRKSEEKVTPGTANESSIRYEVFLEGGLKCAVTKDVYDVVGNYLHSLFPGETEGEVVIR